MEPSQIGAASIVDLSVTLSERLPCTWPGHMIYAHKNWNWFEEREQVTGRTRSENPYQTNFVVIDEHCGTHFDAPTHWIPPEGSGLPWSNSLGEQSGEKVPLEDLMGPAVVVDVRFPIRERRARREPVYNAGPHKRMGGEQRGGTGRGGSSIVDRVGPLLRGGG